MTTSRSAKNLICLFSELNNPGSRAFSMGIGEWPLRGFVVRSGETVAAYVNRCPHAGHALNWRDDEFLTPDRSVILCGSHGALFDIATGDCIAGPCTGQALIKLAVELVGDEVRLIEDPELLQAQHQWR